MSNVARVSRRHAHHESCGGWVRLSRGDGDASCAGIETAAAAITHHLDAGIGSSIAGAQLAVGVVAPTAHGAIGFDGTGVIGATGKAYRAVL